MISLDDAEPWVVENRFGELRPRFTFYSQDGGPEGFLITMPAKNTVHPHFHRIDQFQVMFGAEGAAYQRTKIPVGSVLVHYSDGYATYGPFSTGPDPMDYFTLRAKRDSFIAYMPQDRDKLIYRGRRSIHLLLELGSNPASTHKSTHIEAILEPESDNARAYKLVCAPNDELVGPDVAGSSGQYYVILDGEILSNDKTYGAKSLAWVGPTEEPLKLKAMPDKGFQALVVQFSAPPSVPAEFSA